jgi:hypothetical protein
MGHTFTCDNGGGIADIYVALAVLAWSGAAVNPFDQSNGGFCVGCTTVQPGTGITPTQAGELVVTGIATDFDPTMINSGFALEEHLANINGVHFGVGIAWLIQTAAASVNPTWTISASGEAADSIASFKLAGSITAGPTPGSLSVTGVGR